LRCPRGRGSCWRRNPCAPSAAETGDILDARLRPGNAHTAEGALDFVLDLVDHLAARHLRRPPAEPRMWFHEMTYQAGSWSRPRRIVLVVKERPDDLLLDHFWLLTSCGTTEGHFGELMDVLAPALSSTPRTKRHYRGNALQGLHSGIDAAAPTTADQAHSQIKLRLLQLLSLDAFAAPTLAQDAA